MEFSTLGKQLMSIVLLTIVSTGSAALSVEEAYQAIPHQRTTFSITGSLQSNVNQVYLKALFDLTDQALILRIESMSGIYSSGKYDQVLSQLDALDTPQDARQAQQLILEAIKEQRSYFLNSSERDRQLLIQSSHRKLIKAYNLLMKSFPESQHNKTAFYDHLCALDFI